MIFEKLNNNKLLIFAGGVIVGAIAVAALQSDAFKKSRSKIKNDVVDLKKGFEDDKKIIDIDYDENE